MLTFEGPPEASTESPSKPQPSAEESGLRPETISRGYEVLYARHVYQNVPFELKVILKSPGVPDGTGEVQARGKVTFQAAEPNPTMRVTVAFPKGAFECAGDADGACLQQDRELQIGTTEFSFWLKPLKAESYVITVTISYLSSTQVPEIVERVETVVETNEATGRTKTIERTVKKPQHDAEKAEALASTDLTVHVVSSCA